MRYQKQQQHQQDLVAGGKQNAIGTSARLRQSDVQAALNKRNVVKPKAAAQAAAAVDTQRHSSSSVFKQLDAVMSHVEADARQHARESNREAKQQKQK